MNNNINDISNNNHNNISNNILFKINEELKKSVDKHNISLNQDNNFKVYKLKNSNISNVDSNINSNEDSDIDLNNKENHLSKEELIDIQTNVINEYNKGNTIKTDNSIDSYPELKENEFYNLDALSTKRRKQKVKRKTLHNTHTLSLPRENKNNKENNKHMKLQSSLLFLFSVSFYFIVSNLFLNEFINVNSYYNYQDSINILRHGLTDYYNEPLFNLINSLFTFNNSVNQQLVLLPLLSSLSGAVANVALYSILSLANWKLSLKVLFILLFAFNPLNVYLIASGSHIYVSLLLTLLSVFGIFNWHKYENLQWLLLAGMLSSISFLIYYPSLTISLITTIVLGVYSLKNLQKYKGSLFIYLTPLLFTVAMWSYVQYQQLGNVYWINSLNDLFSSSVLAMDFTIYAKIIVPLIVVNIIVFGFYSLKNKLSVNLFLATITIIPSIINLVAKYYFNIDSNLDYLLVLLNLCSLTIMLSVIWYQYTNKIKILLTTVIISGSLISGYYSYDYINTTIKNNRELNNEYNQKENVKLTKEFNQKLENNQIKLLS